MNKSVKPKCTTRMGFEPTRAEPIGLAVQRLNHSATSSISWSQSKIQTTVLASGHRLRCLGHFPISFSFTTVPKHQLLVSKDFPRRELNPGLLGESQIS